LHTTDVEAVSLGWHVDEDVWVPRSLSADCERRDQRRHKNTAEAL